MTSPVSLYFFLCVYACMCAHMCMGMCHNAGKRTTPWIYSHLPPHGLQELSFDCQPWQQSYLPMKLSHHPPLGLF